MYDSTLSIEGAERPRVSVADAVEAGARLLDERVPGWFYEIDVESLRIQTKDECILGQLYGGSYENGLKKLGLATSPLLSPEHGFSGYPGCTEGVEIFKAWQELDRAWVDAIHTRLAASRATSLSKVLVFTVFAIGNWLKIFRIRLQTT